MSYITKGIVVDAGASLIQNPIYDNKIKVRIPDIHGFGELVTNFQEDSYTKDEDLPWCDITTPAIDHNSYYPILQYKAQTYAPADMVYVQVYNPGPESLYVVQGLYAKYNEDPSNESLTIYNNIDVSKIIENKVEFPKELLDPEDIGDNNEDTDNSDNDEDGFGAANTTKYKYVFGNIFSDKSKYSISARFPKYSSGGKHSGIDLAGPAGTPVYACGDGTVVKVGTGYSGGFGNHVKIKHTTPDGTIYSISAHFRKAPCVSVGDKVKGTQLISDTEYTKAYKKNNDGTYTQLTKKPKDWDNGGWKKYYKKKSENSYEPVGDTRQKGTKIGERGTTGNSTGNHTHFMLTTDPAIVSNSDVKTDGTGAIKNPEHFISF